MKELNKKTTQGAFNIIKICVLLLFIVRVNHHKTLLSLYILLFLHKL